MLKGEIQKRCKGLMIQVCDSKDVSKDHMHNEYPPSKSISDHVKALKSRSSRLLQKEFPGLGKRYWGKYMWGIDMECRKYNRRFDTGVFGASQGSS